MKKTLFSRGLYLESLRRLRVLGFIALAVLLIIQLAPVIISVFDYMYYMENQSDYYSRYDESSYTPSNINFSTVLRSVPFTVIAVAPMMVLSVFSVFNKRASSDFYHALPYTRVCIFTSSMAAVFTWIIGICLITSVVGLLSFVSLPMIFTVIFDGALDLILTYLALLLMTTGATSLAMALTGTPLSNICVTLLILFLPRFILTIMTEWISSSAEFLAINSSGDSFLSPTINVLFAAFTSILYYGEVDFSDNLPADIYSICLGLIYTALAVLVFIRRKSETATQPAPDRMTQHIIRILLTMVIAIYSVILVLEGEIAGCIVVSLVALTVYFAYELVTTRRWKNCLKALPGLGVLFGLCLICGCVMVSVPYIASGYTPEPEDIDSVRLMSSSSRYEDEWFGSEAEDLELKDKAIITTVSEALKNNMKSYKKYGDINNIIYEGKYISSYTSESVMQTVAIKEGATTRYRTICFSAEQYGDILAALENSKAYTDACMTLPEPAKNSLDFGMYNYYNIDASYSMKVFECLQKEIREKTFEEWYNIVNGDFSSYYEFNLNYFTDDYNSIYVYLPISSKDFPKTFNMLLEANNIRYDERLEDLEYILTDEELVENEELWYLNVSVTVKTTDSEGNSCYYNAYSDYSYGDNNYEGTRHDQIYHDAFTDILEKVKTSDEKPSDKSYIYVSYQCDFEEEGMYDEIYLPLPDDFDPTLWDFELLVIDYSDRDQ